MATTTTLIDPSKPCDSVRVRAGDLARGAGRGRGVGVVWEIEIDERVVAIVSEDEDTSGIAPVVCDADGDGLADVREALHRTLGWRVYMAWKQTHSTGTTVERSHDPTRVTQLFNAR